LWHTWKITDLKEYYIFSKCYFKPEKKTAETFERLKVGFGEQPKEKTRILKWFSQVQNQQ
jgi:hypothetical protein